MKPASSVFIWVRTRGTRTVVQPAVLHDASVGPKLEIVAQHPMEPNYYGLSLDELAEIFPPPQVNPDS